eukprot:m.85296 g.85296  ORF g.85296 m.85296 type:complete len:191 (+) comp8738_c0_seq1:47-619(+)
MEGNVELVARSVEKVGGVLDSLSDIDMVELKTKITPMQAVKLDLLMAFSMNSLYWAYLSAKGIDPRTHDVRKELDRVKSEMEKLHGMEYGRKKDPKQPSVNKDAAARMIKASVAPTSKSSLSTSASSSQAHKKESKKKDKKKDKKKKVPSHKKHGKRKPSDQTMDGADSNESKKSKPHKSRKKKGKQDSK